MTCNIKLTVLEVLFGLINLQPQFYYLVDHILLVAKCYVCSCNKKNKELIFNLFLKELKWKLKLEEVVYANKGQSKIFCERLAFKKEML